MATVEHDGSHRQGPRIVTGATSAEIMKETSTCVADALKSNAAENADREVRGVKNAELSRAKAAVGASRSTEALVLIQYDPKSPTRQQSPSIKCHAK